MDALDPTDHSNIAGRPFSLRIFLAHASEDKQVVRKLHKELNMRGFRAWLDEEDLLAGQHWRTEIPKVIQQSDIIVACFSSRSVIKKGYVQKEYRLALDTYSERPPGSIFLIPLKLDECEIPYIEAFSVNIRDLHWIDYSKEDGLSRLLASIETSPCVYHPTDTEQYRGPLSDCTFYINVSYRKTNRWKTLGDVLVEYRHPIRGHSVYLIPSGRVPPRLRHTKVLRSDDTALREKQKATISFVKEWENREIQGKWFIVERKTGLEVVDLYSAAYDSHLIANLTMQFKGRRISRHP